MGELLPLESLAEPVLKAWTRIFSTSRVIALAVAAAAALVSVGVAQGAPGSDATIHSVTLTVPILEARSPAISCPTGTRLTGGGVTSTVDARGYEIQLSGPIGSASGDVPTSWSAYIGNFFSSSDRVFKVSAICSATTDATLAVTSFTVASNSQASKRADCPADSRVIGGGVTSTGPTADNTGAYDVEVSGPVGQDGFTASIEDGDVATRWFAYVSNLTASTQTFRVFAICSKTSDATVEAQPFTITNGTAASATATCPSGKRALGGGVGTAGATPDGTTGSFSGYVVGYSGPVDETGSITNTADGDVARGFASYVLNGSATPQAFKALALCATDTSAPGQGPGGGPGGGGGGGGTGGTTPTCAGKKATIVGTGRRDRIVGTRRSDVIVALGGNDRISGGGGNDTICGGNGNDSISGGSGNDKIYGQNGKDTLSGGAGKDSASGGAGNDKLSGGSGNDTLAGGSGNDKLSGGSGTDKDSGGSGKDGCSGSDTKSSC